MVDLISIITPIILIIGLMNKIGIYTSNEINSSWILSFFSPIEFMISDLEVYIYYAIAIFYLEKVIFTTDRSFMVEFLNANLMLISSFGGLSLLYFFQEKSISTIFNTYLYIALSLNGIGILFLSKKFGKIIGLILILIVPYKLGVAHAHKLSTKSLPIVEITDSHQWFLLDKYSDNVILINKSDKENRFKFIDIKDIDSVKQVF